MQPIDSLYRLFLKHPVICTDTRSITENCLFFALKGEKFNANTFAENALAMGAAFAIIDESEYKKDDRYILVDDVLTCLQHLAMYHRKQLHIPVIALTGSNGKTTTKELIRAVLSSKFKTFATKGNLNNHIGVPLSILSIDSSIEIAVIEMGANHLHEIASLCEIAQPTHGLITNVGMAHLEGFGGFEGVKKGKGELYAWLKAHQGTTFLYSGNDILVAMSTIAGLENIVSYGHNPGDLITGNLVTADPLLQMTWTDGQQEYPIKLHITGAYNFENALTAICIGRYFKLTPEAINSGIESYEPVNNRSQITHTATNMVICDFYNANPSSMTAALNNLHALHAAKKAIILGDMFELGPDTQALHREVVEKAMHAGFDTLLFVGEIFFSTQGERGIYFKTPEEAIAWLSENPLKGSTVLVKGSRGMALERLITLL